MLEVDKTYIEEITELHHEAIPNLKSGREAEKKKAEEHITPGNGSGYEKDE